MDLTIFATYLPKNQEELDVPKNLRGKKKKSCLDSQKGWPMVAKCDENMNMNMKNSRVKRTWNTKKYEMQKWVIYGHILIFLILFHDTLIHRYI